jgi:hypothetical protein
MISIFYFFYYDGASERARERVRESKKNMFTSVFLSFSFRSV